jgi:NAD-dependent deacetylase
MTPDDTAGSAPALEIPGTVRDALRSVRRLVAFTGAGISAESGIPTFREAQTGLWAQYRPEELATPEAFADAPERVWEWYAWRRGLVQAAEPNPGHHALVEMQNLVNAFTLVTQNVDGLHERAGSRDVIELHGNIQRTRCSREGKRIDSWEDGPVPPLCPDCRAHLRPDVVWYGEPLPIQALSQADVAASRCDVFFAIGTSAIVYPAAALPLIALEAGALVVEVNPEATDLSARAGVVRIAGSAARVLPGLVNEIRVGTAG